MLKRVLYGGGVAGALAAAYLLGSLTLGGAFAAPPPPAPPSPPAAQTTANPPASPAQTAPATAASQADQGASTADSGQQDSQPGYTASVTVPQDSTATSEADEAAALQSKAKVTADQAKSTALAQFPGATVQSVGLENENGNVVYGVQLTDKAGAAQDVKVDAGNAKVLNVEAGGPEGKETGAEKGGSETPETPATPGTSTQG
ncbi:MAG: PepSY domain-containing protein [Chloroflexota bacterium]